MATFNWSHWNQRQHFFLSSNDWGTKLHFKTCLNKLFPIIWKTVAGFIRRSQWQRSIPLVSFPVVMAAVWPYFSVKSIPTFPKVAQSVATQCFVENDVLASRKVTMHKGYFCMNIGHRKLSKIARSGHTELQ